MDRKTLTVKQVEISKLFLNPANPRINDEAVPHVVASIRRFGWQQPIVAKPSGEIIAGSTRLRAAQSLQLETVPVVWFDGSDNDALAYGIADNRTHEFSRWDEPALASLLKHLHEEDALEGVGYSEDELDELIKSLDDGTDTSGNVDDPGPEEPPDEPVTCSGDLWLLGENRLLCGDATKPDDLTRLMAGEKASLLATDPPYCVDYTGADRPNGSGKDWSRLYREVDIEDLGAFLDSVFAACLPNLAADAAVYIWHAHLQQPTIAAAFKRHDLLMHQNIVWVKPSATFSHSFYRWRHEPCAFGWLRGNKPPHGAGKLDTVWEIDWEGCRRIVGNQHPTQKPTRLFEIPMEQHTKRGATVLEPFSGSGSQLVAAEKLGRQCRALEICPAFVDVAIRRWQGATGRAAVLDSTQETFAEVARKREIAREDSASASQNS